MTKVEMLISGRRALVDADMVGKMARKQMLLANCLELRAKIEAETNPVCVRLLEESLSETVGKIARLNRTIRPSVQFIKEAV